MLSLHAVPTWGTLCVSTSAFLHVSALGDPLLASDLGSLSSKEEPGPSCATWNRSCCPAGVLLACPGSCIPPGWGFTLKILAVGRSLVSASGGGFDPT